MMGSDSGTKSERPTHSVKINDFFIDAYEVESIAFEEWLVSHNRKKIANEQNPMMPATNVSWHDASLYCNSRDARLQKPRGVCSSWPNWTHLSVGRTSPSSVYDSLAN